MAEPSTPARSGRLRRAARGLAALALGSCLTLVGLELALRWVALSDSDLARKIGGSLRDPRSFASEDVDDEYWHLQRQFAGPEAFGGVPEYDPLVGWCGDLVVPRTYEHLDAASVGARTPVLFYGDSFAQCVVPKPQCFQSILERGDLGATHRLLNYGVGGFGLDQSYLLMTRTVDHWKGRDPIVVLSILVESDLDRCALSFRSWPKPRLRVESGELVEPDPGAAPIPGVEEYFASHEPRYGSLLWRALVYRELAPILGWQWERQLARARVDEKKELSRAILASAHRMLEARGLRHFVLLFHVRGPLRDPSYLWQEPFLRETCAELGLPVISVRPWFDAVIGPGWSHSELYYLSDGPGAGHYNAPGNEIAFEALRAGVLGRFGPADTSHLLGRLERRELPSPTDRMRQLVLLGRNTWITAHALRSVVRAGTASRIGSMYDPGDGSEAVCIRGGELGATRVQFDLDASPQTFRAELLAVKRPGVECPMPRLEVEILARDETAFRGEIGAQPIPVEIDLSDSKTLVVRVTSRDGDSECGWVVLAHPRFEPR